MFDNLVTYYVHQSDPLPANNALAYQYVLAGNGIFIRAETHFFEAVLPIAPCAVRGLTPLHHHFRLKVPRIPARLLDTILANARRARRSDGSLNEVLYQFCHRGQTIQVRKPVQKATPTSIKAIGIEKPEILCDLHSHANMPANFSPTDNRDERGARVYAIIGKLDNAPEIRLRVGLYGYWLPLPVTAVFTDSGPFKEII